MLKSLLQSAFLVGTASSKYNQFCQGAIIIGAHINQLGNCEKIKVVQLICIKFRVVRIVMVFKLV